MLRPKLLLRPPRQARTIVVLGLAQTLAWASTYYLPAMLAAPMARDLGVTAPTVFAAFSAALVVAACVGPWAGRLIDRWGGRPVLLATSGLAALGLVLLATAQGLLSLFAAWLVLGIVMGAGLYEAAFATLVRIYGHAARGPITGITLIAGFASTVGWPLSAWFEHVWGWRGACLAWAGLHLLIGVPLHFWLPAARADASATESTDTVAPPRTECPARWTTALLATAFAITWFISTAMAAHLPQLLQVAGLGLAAAVFASALVGPAQVAARIGEFTLLRRLHPLLSARLAALAHPLGTAALLVIGAPAGIAFTILHGAGNGILTVAKGTMPLAIFGPQGYGARQGLLMVPARIAQAVAPFAFGLALEGFGVQALWLTAGLGLLAWITLMRLRASA